MLPSLSKLESKTESKVVPSIGVYLADSTVTAIANVIVTMVYSHPMNGEYTFQPNQYYWPAEGPNVITCMVQRQGAKMYINVEHSWGTYKVRSIGDWSPYFPLQRDTSTFHSCVVSHVREPYMG